MDLTRNDAVITCVGVGGWYPAGVRRLERSLHHVGNPLDTLFYTEEIPGYLPHADFPYYFKIAAFEELLKKGYRKGMWVDSSFWAVRPPMPIFDIAEDRGFFAFRSGNNLAQSVNDYALNAVGLSRDKAVGAIEYATGCVVINFEHQAGQALYKLWKEYMDVGLSKGSRGHGGQSADPRFLHHRQDQSCFSLAIWKLGLSVPQSDYISYFKPNYDHKNLIFFINGL